MPLVTSTTPELVFAPSTTAPSHEQAEVFSALSDNSLGCENVSVDVESSLSGMPLDANAAGDSENVYPELEREDVISRGLEDHFLLRSSFGAPDFFAARFAEVHAGVFTAAAPFKLSGMARHAAAEGFAPGLANPLNLSARPPFDPFFAGGIAAVRKLFGSSEEPAMSDLKAKAGEGIPLTDVLAFLTSGIATPSMEKLSQAIEGGTDGLKGIAGISPGNRRYWEEILDRYYVESQFSTRARGVVELITNGIDATLRMGKKTGVDAIVEDGRVIVEDKGPGMGPVDIFSKLLVPSLGSNENGSGEEVKPIGRFGVGFYSALAFLNGPNDSVTVRTSQGDKTYYIFFTRRDGRLNVAMTASPRLNSVDGTRVEVHSDGIRKKDVVRLVSETLGYSRHMPVVVNGGRINPKRDLKPVAKGDLGLYYSPELPDEGEPGRAVITVNGVAIHQMPLAGSNVPKLLVFDLPPATPLPISRNAIELPAETVAAIRAFFGAIPDSEEKATVLNGLWALVKFFQARNPSFSASDDLTLAFKHRVGELLRDDGLFLPDAEAGDLPHLRRRMVDREIYDPSYSFGKQVRPYTGLRIDGARAVLGDLPRRNGAAPMALRQGGVVIVNSASAPQDIVGKAVLAAWLGTEGLNASLEGSVQEALDRPHSIGARLGEGAIMRYARRIASMAVGYDAKRIMDHPIYGPLYEQVIRTIIRRCGSRAPMLFASVAGAFSELLRAPSAPEWHPEFVLKMTELITADYRESSVNDEYDEAIMAGISMCLVFRRQPELAGFVEGHLEPEEAKLFRVFLRGVPNPEMIARIIQMVARIEEDYPNFSAQAKAAMDKYGKNQSLIMKELFSDRGMRFLFIRSLKNVREDLLPVYPLMAGIQLPERIRDEAAAKRYSEEIRGVVERWISGGRNPRSLHKELVRLQAISAFLRTSQGRKIASDPAQWARWENIVVDKTPFDPGFEKDLMIVGGYLSLDGFFEEVYALFGDKRTTVFRDFLQFVGALSSHYYQGSPPPDFVRRCLRIWSERILKLGRIQYDELRSDFYLMFAIGADEIFLSSRLQPYVSYAIGDIQDVVDLAETQIWRLEGEGVVRFRLSDHIARYLQQDGGAPDSVGGDGTLNRRFARRSLGQAINDQSSDPSIHLRELLQNTRDEAAKRNATADERVFQVETQKSPDGELVTTFSDPFGMPPQVVDDILLIPGRTTKADPNDRGDQIGRFGQGFFSLFKAAKRVVLRTRVAGGVPVELEFVPERNEKGRVVDVQVSQRVGVSTGMEKGTRIQIMQDSAAADIDAAFLEVYLRRYGGNLPAQHLRVELNGRQVNKNLTAVAEANTPWGDVVVYSGGERAALTHRGLYVRPLGLEYFYDLPPMLRFLVEQNGIVVDLPGGVGLTRDRSDIAGKEKIMPVLRRAVANGLLKHAMSDFLTGNLPFSALPYDLYESGLEYSIPEDVAADARRVAAGKDVDLASYLGEERLQLLIIAMPVIPVAGSEVKMSLMDIIKEANYRSDFLISRLPAPVRNYLQSQRERISMATEQSKGVFEAKGLTESRGIELPTRPDEDADAYWAFMELANAVGNFMNRAARLGQNRFKKSAYVSSEEHFGAQATGGLLGGLIEWNLLDADDSVSLLGKIIRGEATEVEIFGFWKGFLSTASHEQTHLFENARRGELTHDRGFYEMQQGILDFLNKNASQLKKMLRDICSRYRGTFLPAGDFLVRVNR